MHKRRLLLWRLYPSYLLIVLVTLGAVAWYATYWVRHYQMDKMKSDLKARAITLAILTSDKLGPDERARLVARLREIGAATGARLTVILDTGQVIADSELDPALMTNHRDRPEIIPALSGEITVLSRDSYTFKKEMLFAAAPIRSNDRVVAAARVSFPIIIATHAMQSMYRSIMIVGFGIGLMGALLSFIVTRRLTKTVGDLKLGAEQFASGNLFYRMDPGASDELGALAEAMHGMAEQLQERLSIITSQRNELEAVLAGMVEALVVVDTRERIIRLNRSAGDLLGIAADSPLGRDLLEVVRNSDLHRLVRTVLDSQQPAVGDVAFPGEPERLLQARCSAIRDTYGRAIGAIVLLNDVTRLRALERIRKDFVANVSHELKTPVTSIKGFLETLREGAIHDPEASIRFVDIMIGQADRLSMIIEDLLSLSRIEQAAEKGAIALEPCSPAPVIEAAYRACLDLARERGASLDWTSQDDVVARINPTLLEQALVNLVDNALKYGPPGNAVKISCACAGNEIVIAVQDKGYGIPKEHLSRVFGRFYRVDKTRSRDSGGTGLGLAIVKHIVSAHNGRISVESSLGAGSAFSIYLPAAAP
jgi:two-component system phosphate regulon sensor histidine kinase PhoR